MEILIVGTGGVASILSKALASDKNVTRIICASRNMRKARDFISTTNRKISLAQVDASRVKQIVKVAKDVSLIINASLPNFNETIMEAALKVGANYQDLCSYLLDFKHPEQLRFDKRFKKERLVGLINTGLSPGITNLLAREAADHLDTLTEIKIRLIEEQKAKMLVFSWSPQIALDLHATLPLTYKNKRLAFAMPFGDQEEYTFPASIGKRKVVNIFGDEVATLPLYLKAKTITFKSGGEDVELMRAFYELGLLSRKPVLYHHHKITPFEFFSKLLPPVPSPMRMRALLKKRLIDNALYASVVEAIGKKEKKNVRIRYAALFPDLRTISRISPGATYISYPTGIAVAAFSRITADIDTFGVFPPEALKSHYRKAVLQDIKRYGITIQRSLTPL